MMRADIYYGGMVVLGHNEMEKAHTRSKLPSGGSVCEQSVCPCDGLATHPGCIPAS